MQVAVVEFARNVCGFTDANSGEFDERSTHKVINLMPDQYVSIAKGGTMRLGAYPCKIKDGTLMKKHTRQMRYQNVTDTDMSLIMNIEKYWKLKVSR